jgi:hypothetical protein
MFRLLPSSIWRGLAVPLVSIAITPANPSIAVGVSQQFAAIGIYSDGTSHDIGTQVTWSSSNTSGATVNSSGLVTIVATGSTAITAASGSISGSTTLTVPSSGGGGGGGGVRFTLGAGGGYPPGIPRPLSHDESSRSGPGFFVLFLESCGGGIYLPT